MTSCRHCPAPIILENGRWTDPLGMTACVKGALVPVQDRASGQPVFAPPVPHEPMPAGLRGAPAAQ